MSGRRIAFTHAETVPEQEIPKTVPAFADAQQAIVDALVACLVAEGRAFLKDSVEPDDAAAVSVGGNHHHPPSDSPFSKNLGDTINAEAAR
jgi:hypothetical protein